MEACGLLRREAWLRAAVRTTSLSSRNCSLTNASGASVTLSDPARLIYASLVDGTSDEARETIAGVDVVWRNREGYRKAASHERKSVLETICCAVEELISSGLLLLLDEQSISGGWVRKPWEGLPS
jgi:hypothetical protein